MAQWRREMWRSPQESVNLMVLNSDLTRSMAMGKGSQLAIVTDQFLDKK
jgi:hypothetical protein